MLKFETRKLASVVIALLAVGMMAACSGSSSTDDPLTPPGGNALTTVRFDVNPSTNTVDVTPVASPWSTNPIYGDGSGNIDNVTISTANVTNGALDFDVTVSYTGGTYLQNVRLGVNSSTDLGVILSNSDKCAGPWSGCLPGNDPAITFISDNASEGGTTFFTYDPTDPANPTYWFDNAILDMVPGCTLNTKHWTLSNAPLPFSFWATLYGDSQPANVAGDSNYDPNTAAVYTIPKVYTGQNTHGGDVNVVTNGDWFYVHVYLDNPGNNRPLAWDPNLIPGAQRMEDTGNVAAWANGGSSTANYWFMGYAGVAIRFDPAVIEVNTTLGTVEPPSSGAFTFFTDPLDNPSNIKLKMLIDPNLALDLYDFSAAGTPQSGIFASNILAIFKQQTMGPLATGSYNYANPCGINDTAVCSPGFGTDSITSIDWDMFFVPLHAKRGVTGGSVIRASYHDGTLLIAQTTNGNPGNPGIFATMPRSANWGPFPTDATARYAAWGDGEYNINKSYICVQ